MKNTSLLGILGLCGILSTIWVDAASAQTNPPRVSVNVVCDAGSNPEISARLLLNFDGHDQAGTFRNYSTSIPTSVGRMADGSEVFIGMNIQRYVGNAGVNRVCSSQIALDDASGVGGISAFATPCPSIRGATKSRTFLELLAYRGDGRGVNCHLSRLKYAR